jgi:signal transduction histidine kinase
MLNLDVGTLAFSSALVSVATAAIIFVIGGVRRRDLPWGYFATSAALYGIGVLLIIFRLPDWKFSFVTGGNTLVLLSTLAAHAGACVIARRKIPVAVYGFATLGLVLAFWIAHAAFPNINARIVLISLARLPFFIHGAIMLYRVWREHRLRSTSVLEATFLVWVGLILVRIADVAMRDNRIEDFLSLDGYQALYFMAALLSMASLGIAVLLMDVEREEVFLGRQITAITADLQKAKDAAEAALGAKSRFLAAAGHDLRQAVHALRLLLTAATDDESEDKAEYCALFEEMDCVIGGMAEQLNALLDMSRLDAGAIVPCVSDCAIEDIFRRVEHGFGRSALAGNVELRFVSTSCMVRTDPALLTRILGNLVANGIKFAPDGRVLVGCRRRGGEVLLQVCDDGIGIPADKIDEIFEEYRQLHNPARQQTKGLGLGLAIITRLADLLGHKISVASIPGRGTIVTVRMSAV